MTQRDMMRLLVSKYGQNKEKVCRAYATAESRNVVPRHSNKYGLTAEQYAAALYEDGMRKKWF